MMRNLSHFLVMSDIFCEHSHPQRNLYMFETPSSSRIFFFSKNKKACLIIADLSHAKKVSTQELYINDEKYSFEKHSRSDILIINCFLGGASISPPISPESSVFMGIHSSQCWERGLIVWFWDSLQISPHPPSRELPHKCQNWI